MQERRVRENIGAHDFGALFQKSYKVYTLTLSK